MPLPADPTRARSSTDPDGRLVRRAHTRTAPPRRSGARMRVLVVLTVGCVSWVAASVSAEAAVGVPVTIDGFGKP